MALNWILKNTRLDRRECDWEEICQPKELAYYDTNVSHSMLFKISNLRNVSNFYIEKKCFHVQLNLRNVEC